MELNSEQIGRFWSKVAIKEFSDCWEWLGSKKVSGYGQLMLNYYNFYSHRISWQIHNGPIPKGLFVLHKCDNPSCVNPKHLFLGTQLDNMRDRNKKGRAPLGEKSNCNVLTNEKVLKIKQLYQKENKKQGEIAKLFNVSPQLIWNIIHQKTWKYI